MGITFDDAFSDTATGDTVLFDATVAETGSIMIFFNSNSVGYGSYQFATIRFNSIDATFVGQQNTGNRSVGVWVLVNPSTGTHQVEMAFSSNFDKSGAVAIYKSAKQTGQPDADAGDKSASEATKNIAITIIKGQSWLVGAWAAASGNTPSSGTTQRIDQVDSGTGTHLYVGDSAGGLASGAQSLEYSGGTHEWAGVVVSVANNDAEISVADSLTITESASIGSTSNILVSDALTITESRTIGKVINITVSEAISITESVSINNTNAYANVFDAITILETRVVENYPDVAFGVAYMDSLDSSRIYGLDVLIDSLRMIDSRNLTGLDDSTGGQMNSRDDTKGVTLDPLNDVQSEWEGNTQVPMVRHDLKDPFDITQMNNRDNINMSSFDVEEDIQT